MKRRSLHRIVIALVAVLAALPVGAQRLNDKLLNRPYADGRAWYLGFSLGMHVQDALITHNGLVTEDGRTWFVDQPDYSPGFCVNGMVGFRLNDYFGVRISPGLWFGNRELKMIDTTLGNKESQNYKATYVVVPFDLRYSALRYRNSRPYITGGIMPAFDVTKKRDDILKLSNFDTYLTIGFGCDFYLPYFKFIPEVKFCFGMLDLLKKDRPDLTDEPQKYAITQSLSKVKSKMIVFTFYFE